MTDAVVDALNRLVTVVPLSHELPAEDAEGRSQVIARRAAFRAAAISGSLALPPGPLGMITLLPDLVQVWRVQQQMVSDLAAVRGHAPPGREEMVYCLFRHGAALLMRDLVVRGGGRLLVRRTSLQTMQRLLSRIGVKVTQSVLNRSIARYVPIAGAVGIGAYAYYDTWKVAKTAISLYALDAALHSSALDEIETAEVLGEDGVSCEACGHKGRQD